MRKDPVRQLEKALKAVLKENLRLKKTVAKYEKSRKKDNLGDE